MGTISSPRSRTGLPGDGRPLRIAMVGQKGLPATFGGVEHHVEQLGSRLAERGHEVTVYCRSSYGRTAGGTFGGMRLRSAPTVGTRHLDAIVHSLTSTVLAIASGADVVHYHALGPGMVSVLPRYASRSKVVLTVHGLDHQRAKWNLGARTVLRAAHWLSGRVPDRVVVVSHSLQQHYRDRFGRDTDYICNGAVSSTPVRDAAVRGLGLEPGRYALFVGRLVPEKRPDLLLRAFRQIDTDQRLAIVGDSSFSDGYTGEIRALAAQDPRVVLTGYVFGDDQASLYQHAAVFVQPSALEGLPLTILEAIAHDVPVLVTDIPPHIEVLREGSSRHRIVPVDDPDALSYALTEMLVGVPQDERAHQLRADVLARYSWDAAAAQLEALYLELLGRTSPARHLTRPEQTETPLHENL